MHVFAPVLLFILNLVDGLLTIAWVRSGVATEGNGLMAHLLDIGNGPFLLAKIGMGTFAAIVFYRGGGRPLAKYGLALTLVLYVGVMGIHLFTGLWAFGYVSTSELRDLLEFPGHLSALIT
jgi:hypothetical protein